MTKVTIKLPENIEEITLEQYQRFDKLTKREDLNDMSFAKRLIEIFTELKYRDIGNVSDKDNKFMVEQITKALSKDVPFKSRFTMDGIEYGFIPNLDEATSNELDALSTGEFVDGSNHIGEVENYHKLMAVLFRPITSKDSFGNYKIEDYNGTSKYANRMKRVPMNIMLGALGFFFHLSRELRIHFLKSTKEVQAKVDVLQDTLINGDGTLQSAV